MPTAKKPTSVTQWKKKAAAELELPSGNICLCRRPGLQVFIKEGVIPDSLTSLVMKALQGKPEDAQSELAKAIVDPQKVTEMFDLVDAVTMAAVVEPHIAPAPTEKVDGRELTIPIGDPRRKDDVLYIDEVDAEDKMFVFQWSVGGTRDIERFRQEQKATMDSLHPGEAVGVPSE